MLKRARHRARYIDGLNTMDAVKLPASATEGFVFDDPADPQPVTTPMLVGYMPVWPAKAKELGAAFEFEMSDKVEQDRDGILTEWCWWWLTATGVEGSAFIKTGGDGVMSERLTYYRTPWPLRK